MKDDVEPEQLRVLMQADARLDVMHFELMAEHFKDILDRIIDLHLAVHQFGLSGKIPDVFDNAGCALDIGDNIRGHAL